MITDKSTIDPPDEKPEQVFSTFSPREKREFRFSQEIAFWIIAWLGTALSGSAFGLAILIKESFRTPAELIVFFIPLIFGFVVAGVFALPCVATIAVITWGLWLTRFRMLTATIAGGWTGVIATQCFFPNPPFFMGFTTGQMEVMACIFGAVGCPLFAYLFRYRDFSLDKKEPRSKAPWQFTLRDLFVHFTVLAVLISLWTWYFTVRRENLERIRRLDGQQQSETSGTMPAQPGG